MKGGAASGELESFPVKAKQNLTREAARLPIRQPAGHEPMLHQSDWNHRESYFGELPSEPTPDPRGTPNQVAPGRPGMRT